MKKNPASEFGFSTPRVLLAFLFCSVGVGLAMISFAPPEGRRETGGQERPRYMPVPGGKADDLDRLESEWHNRLTYPTGQFNPRWLRQAAVKDAQIMRKIPLGLPSPNLNRGASALALDPAGFTALGPQPLRMTGCSGCYDYTTTAGRVNDIVIDPTTTTPPSLPTSRAMAAASGKPPTAAATPRPGASSRTTHSLQLSPLTPSRSIQTITTRSMRARAI